jgi:hypothetical protein
MTVCTSISRVLTFVLQDVALDGVDKIASKSAHEALFLPSGLGHIDGTIALDVFAKQAFTFSYAGHSLRFLDARALEEKTKILHAMPQ